MKLGGNADACFVELTDEGEFGSEMNTVCSAVMTCFLLIVRYGCTIGKPSGVVQMTDVICSLRSDFAFSFPAPSMAASTRSGGMDLVIKRAEVFSQS